MGNLHECISDDLKAFAESQPVFFVATAPSHGGHVNVAYHAQKNRVSIDGLPGVRQPRPQP